MKTIAVALPCVAAAVAWVGLELHRAANIQLVIAHQDLDHQLLIDRQHYSAAASEQLDELEANSDALLRLYVGVTKLDVNLPEPATWKRPEGAHQ